MKTRIRVLLGLSFLLFFLAPPLIAQVIDDEVELEKGYEHPVFPALAKIKANKTRLRKGPSLKHQPIGRFMQGDELIVIDKEKQWYLVASPQAPEKPLGWVFAELMQLSPNPTLEKQEPEAETATQTKIVEEPPAVIDAPKTDEPATSAPVTNSVQAVTTATAEPQTANITPEAVDEKKTEATTTKAAQPDTENKTETVPVEAPAEPLVDHTTRKSLKPFAGDTNYSVPEYKGWRGVYLQLTPMYNWVVENRNGQLDDQAFRGVASIGLEVLPTIYVTGFYAFVSYTPDQATHEAGGGVRWQVGPFWHLQPYIEGGMFYSSLLDDANLGVRGSGGILYNLGGRYYEIAIGPVVEFNRVSMGAPGDVDNWAVGLGLQLTNFLTD